MHLSRNDPCWCGSQKKWKKCHFPELPHSFDSLTEKYLKNYHIYLKTPEQIEGIRKACQLTAYILEEVCKKAKKGVTTNFLNEFAEDLHYQAGARAAPLGYGNPPFPKSICTSLNEVICHGIPDDTPLKEGDILNIDVSCELNGYFGDCSRMVMIGEVKPEKKKLVEVTYQCLMESIKILAPGVPLCEIGNTIDRIATHHKYGVVYQFVGHGVGLEFHEAPQVLHYHNQMNIPLAPGMIFTIEPMINQGSAKAVIEEKGWIAYTADGQPSAQWEHTVLITDTGHEILTDPVHASFEKSVP